MTLYFIKYDAMKSHGGSGDNVAYIFSHSTIQGDLGEKVSIVGDNDVGHWEKE